MSLSDPKSLLLSGRRLLIVEDDPLISLDLQDLLEGAGATVLGPVATVAAALELLQAEAPHAALLDLNLRGEPSTPVAEALISAGIPFVLVTGYSRRQIEEPSLRDGAIVSKPVQPSKLLRALQNLLEI